MTRIATISIVRNEEDVIETWVRHHAPMVTRMRIVLHRCTDGTESILRRLKEEGFTLELGENAAEHYPQEEVMRALLREAAADADWVLPLDADEFLCGAPRLPPAGAVLLLPWRTYVPLPSDDVTVHDLLRRVTHRRWKEEPQYRKAMVPAALARDPDARLPLGNHALVRASTGEAYPAEEAAGMWLAHFPVRSETQLRGKIAAGWESQRRNPAHRPGQIFQWEALSARCADPRHMEAEELRDIALRYAVPEDVRTGREWVRDPVRRVSLRTVAGALAADARQLEAEGMDPADAEGLVTLLFAEWATEGAISSGSAPPEGGGAMAERIRAFLRETDRDAVRAALAETHGTGDLLLHFYEYFLDAYDPARGGAGGVCYTPAPVADFLARSADAMLRAMGHGGLADPRVRVTDLAAGTGALLTAAMRLGARRAGGIELMDVPGLFARLRMGLDGEWTTGDMLRDDAVIDRHLERIGADGPDVTHAVFSNPPYYRHFAGGITPGMRAVYRRYGDPRALGDAWIRSLARVHAILLRSGTGVAAMVVPRELLTSSAYAGIRQALARDFAEIRTVDLGGGPGGGPLDENAFSGCGVPLCLLLLARGGTFRRTLTATLRGPCARKLAALSRDALRWREAGRGTWKAAERVGLRARARSALGRPERLLIACTSNEHYAPGTAVMVRSLLERLPPGRGADIVVLETRLSDGTKAKLRDSWRLPGARVRFLQPDARMVQGLKLTQHMQPEVYYRLLLPDLLPGASKALYLDSDMLVLRDISPVWGTQMAGHPVAAVRDVLLSTTLKDIPGHAGAGLDPEAHYCSTGLLLMDLDRWREEGLTERTLEFIRAHPECIRWWDQDGLNAVLNGDWLGLDPLWNVYAEAAVLYGWKPESGSRSALVRSLVAGQRIVHFATRYKPWLHACPHPKARLWLEHLDRTAWKGWRPEPGSEMPWPPRPLA